MPTVKQLKEYLNSIPEDTLVKVLTDNGEYFDRYLKRINLDLKDPKTIILKAGTLHLGNDNN
jgi:hypothetical protein